MLKNSKAIALRPLINHTQTIIIIVIFSNGNYVK